MEPVNFQLAVEKNAVQSADLCTDSLMRLPIDQFTIHDLLSVGHLVYTTSLVNNTQNHISCYWNSQQLLKSRRREFTHSEIPDSFEKQTFLKVETIL